MAGNTSTIMTAASSSNDGSPRRHRDASHVSIGYHLRIIFENFSKIRIYFNCQNE